MGNVLCKRQPSTFDNPLNQYPQINNDLDKAVDLVIDSGHLSNRLLLKFKCENLPNMDFLSKTDWFLVLYELSSQQKWTEVGRTEIIEDNLNPEFIQAVQVVYNFEEDQKYKIEAYDADDFDQPILPLEKANYIGEVCFDIQRLVSRQDRSLQLTLANKKSNNRGTVIMTFEEGKSPHNQILELSLKAEESEFSDNASYFYIIGAITNTIPSRTSPVMRSEVIRFNENNNCWRKSKIPLSCLDKSDQGFDLNKIAFQIQLYRHDKSGNHKLLCTHETTIIRVLEYDSLLKLKSFTDDGEYYLRVNKWNLVTVPSFLDYINAGLDMNLLIGVDFTASNGDPTFYNSLHHLGPNKNQYLTAIYEVGKILLNFDTDQEVPLFGFGGVLPNFYSQVSHWFAMNGNIFRPEVTGIEGITSCYQNVLSKIKFSGPTYFSKLLKYWVNMVKFEYEANKQKYYIFMILTDGVIHDIDETVDWIVESSSLPWSIIIIGIGDADFSQMDFLDADDSRLFSTKHQKFQERDNVQFVEFNKFKDNPNLLARETLEELPRQLLDFYKKRKIGVEEIKHEHCLEAKEFFSYKGQEFLEYENKPFYPQDFLQSMINEGIADSDNLDINKCMSHYYNVLK